ncbi:tRNA 2-selenouridine(34) synthase MnmH [Gammaproteobacteria bacterium 50_400_T64]|nr:tRNA 2-selenouridine(34) synthase MnmH [Gammaproteobacteria bacterium 50_400_T64]
MTTRPDTEHYRELFLNDVPMMDMRAPVEFNKGAFPCSENIPLLDDKQREAVGTCYKQKGQDAAIALGWQLATPEIREQRIVAWQDFIQRHPEGYLYCFRGGLRSRLSQQLVGEAGTAYPLVTGGYKAMRRFLIDELDQHCETLPLTLVSGRTGSGKTLVIRKLAHALDLEGLANHRGSAFGRQIQAQPNQIDFENSLSIAVMKQCAQHQQPIFAEDEGRMIGGVTLPMHFIELMQKSPLAVLETPIAERIDIVLADYITEAYPQYIAKFGEEEGAVKFREQILGNLTRIRKRLGGERFTQLHAEFSEALDALINDNDARGFRSGIQLLLTDYYDPMYDYQQGQREGRVVFRGERAELLQWAEAYSMA